MIRDFYELNAEYPIYRIILGEERIKKSNTKAKWIFGIISILIILFCFIFNKYEHRMLIIFFASLISLVIIVYDNYKSIENLKIQIPDYKPNFMSYLKGIDWNNYLIEEKWFEIIKEKRYYKISTNTLKYNYAITKMELSEKPKIDYSNLLNILNIIISVIIVAAITPIKEHLNVDLKNKQDFNSYIFFITIIFFLFFI
jgi:MFS superfamily sulfate permease-like transporter